MRSRDKTLELICAFGRSGPVIMNQACLKGTQTLTRGADQKLQMRSKCVKRCFGHEIEIVLNQKLPDCSCKFMLQVEQDLQDL